MERIGIGPGSFISFDEKGRPYSNLKIAADEQIEAVERWQRGNRNHRQFESSKEWCLAKQKEIAEAKENLAIERKRQAVDREIGPALRKLRKLPKLARAVRIALYAERGVVDSRDARQRNG
jgi:phosphoenolpyruvate synthase/pyruvate phosphate dikinase